VTTEQDVTPEHCVTSGTPDDTDEERGDDDGDDDAQPAMADSVATAMSAIPGRTRPVIG
jgi:hypothetical protein